MPELPDIELYRGCLEQRILGQALERVRVGSPFLVRSTEPTIDAAVGRRVVAIRRIGKRVVVGLEGDLFLVIHLMIAGRMGWKARGAKVPGKIGLACFDFPNGCVVLTEASTQKRASLHVVRGEGALALHDPGGVEPLEVSVGAFSELLRRGNHTLKRTLTDPRLIAGIGNAYGDEILHAAGLSPVQLTGRLKDEEIARLHAAMQTTLRTWMDRLRAEFATKFPGPGDVTAFRPDFAVHGKFGKPCPACRVPVQRIRYAENETNYCPRCQTGGKVLADRSWSRLLKEDWPRTVEELESL
ncbi:MAG: formamidopyrimidine-DNA glycosylase [Planctomycetes bacterium]|nr:formamidopyrimidine-DNA glycosylase [Planctomycetota bacterium]